MNADKHTPRIEKLEILSTEQLERMIHDDCYGITPLEEDYINDIITLLQARRHSSSSPEAAINVAEAWEKFQNQYMSRVENKDTAADREKYIAQKFSLQCHNHTLWLRVASIAAILCVVIFGISVTSAYGAENIFTAMGQWTSQLFFFKYDTPKTFSDNLDLVKLKNLADVAFDTENLVPSWLPDGFEMRNFDVFGNNAQSELSASFSNTNRSIFYCATFSSENVQTNYEKDNTVVDVFVSNGVSHYFTANNNQVIVVWEHNGIECRLTGDATTEELKTIISSIYEREG